MAKREKHVLIYTQYCWIKVNFSLCLIINILWHRIWYSRDPGLRGHCHQLMVANAGVRSPDCLHSPAHQPIRGQGLRWTANQRPGTVYSGPVRCDHLDHNHCSHHRSHRRSVSLGNWKNGKIRFPGPRWNRTRKKKYIGSQAWNCYLMKTIRTESWLRV